MPSLHRTDMWFRGPFQVPCALAPFALSAVMLLGCTLGDAGTSGGGSSSTSASGGATSIGGSSTSSGGTTTHTGGAGGTTTTGGSGGSTTTTGGAGGGAPECVASSDCPAPEDPCITAECVSGTCGEGFSAAGTPLPTQTPGDCTLIVCDGAGTAIGASDDVDIFDDGNVCTLDECESGTPLNTPLPAGAVCNQAGGKVCDGSGACVACLQASDCTSPDVCSPAHGCVPPTCEDGMKDGAETDVDCGGSCGATCGTGLTCATGSDCASSVCAGVKCAAPACDDGVKNGGESDVDCGGPCSKRCGPGMLCTVDSDCLIGWCSGSVCLPSCVDGVKNNAETDVDCGGPFCDPCAAGSPCASATDCMTGYCVDGVCCDTACSGLCAACTTALKGAGPNGVCAPIQAGSDPQWECALGVPSLCSSSPDGMCNGAGECTTWAVGTMCEPATCVGGDLRGPSTCVAFSVCQMGSTTSCSPYVCSLGACLSSCNDNWQCASGAVCIGNACVPMKPNGSPCSVAAECLSKRCADGVCCSTLCDGPCVSCDLPGSVGTCSNLPANASDPPLCPAPNTCGANGDCPGYLPVGAPCGSFPGGIPGEKPPECNGLYCADNVCCKTSCTDPCHYCFGGTCSPVNGGVDPWPVNSFNGCGQPNACASSCQECGPNATCVSPLGTICGAGDQCISGNCVDGRCCGSACAGLCQSCNQFGNCHPIPAGEDPDNECPGAQTCNGAGACQ